MKKILLMCVAGGLFSSAVLADELLETVPAKDKDRRVVIEMIRVSSERQVIATEETDAEVKSILDELDTLEEDVVENDESEGSS